MVSESWLFYFHFFNLILPQSLVFHLLLRYTIYVFLYSIKITPPVLLNIGDFWRFPENQKLNFNILNKPNLKVVPLPPSKVWPKLRGILKNKKERRIVKKI